MATHIMATTDTITIENKTYNRLRERSPGVGKFIQPLRKETWRAKKYPGCFVLLDAEIRQLATLLGYRLYRHDRHTNAIITVFEP